MSRLRKNGFTKRVIGHNVLAPSGASLLVCTGIALGHFTSVAGNQVDAPINQRAVVSVNQTSSLAGLAPGLPARRLSGDFDNRNTGSVYVSAVTAAVRNTDKPGCDASNYVITGAAPIDQLIPSGISVGSWGGLAIQFVTKPAINQDACKGALVSIVYTVR